MKFEKFSADTVSELLIYLAKNENFDSLKGINSITKSDVVELFNELAKKITDISAKSYPTKRDSLQSPIPESLNQVLANLTPQEESILFSSFRVS